MTRKPNLRKCVNDMCISCVYDQEAAGTWRQQVTLCSVKGCALFPVRPVTKAPIPDRVLDYYMVTGAERAFYSCLRPLEGSVTEHNEAEEYPSEGSLKATVEKGPICGDTP